MPMIYLHIVSQDQNLWNQQRFNKLKLLNIEKQKTYQLKRLILVFNDLIWGKYHTENNFLWKPDKPSTNLKPKTGIKITIYSTLTCYILKKSNSVLIRTHFWLSVNDYSEPWYLIPKVLCLNKLTKTQ